MWPIIYSNTKLINACFKVSDFCTSTKINSITELYAGNGQVGFIAHSRNDGILTQAEAVKTITQLT